MVLALPLGVPLKVVSKAALSNAGTLAKVTCSVQTLAKLTRSVQTRAAKQAPLVALGFFPQHSQGAPAKIRPPSVRCAKPDPDVGCSRGSTASEQRPPLPILGYVGIRLRNVRINLASF